MGEQHANGYRVSRHRLVADATVGVMETLKVSVDTSTRPRRALLGCARISA